MQLAERATSVVALKFDLIYDSFNLTMYTNAVFLSIHEIHYCRIFHKPQFELQALLFAVVFGPYSWSALFGHESFPAFEVIQFSPNSLMARAD